MVAAKANAGAPLWPAQGNKAYRMAKRNRLLRKNYGAEESSGFIDRNLNDTRYICKFFKNYVEEHLQLAARADGQTNRRGVVVNGQLTSFLRTRWGLTKVRADSDRHHAMDAAVVAACTHSMVKALADYSRRKEIEYLQEGFPDPATGEILNPAAFDRVKQHFPSLGPISAMNCRHGCSPMIWQRCAKTCNALAAIGKKTWSTCAPCSFRGHHSAAMVAPCTRKPFTPNPNASKPREV
jgi:CRISPR/Cas system Type II protein with McrA/HNH and RuvC-like nuclease domain